MQALDDGSQYVTLGLDREVFAVEVHRVREILDVPPIAKLPNGPAYLLGMIDVRGECVPVIDLRAKLGFAPAAHTLQTRILVLEVEVCERRLVMGLLADRVFEVTPLDGVEAPPDIGVRWHSEYIQGIGRRGDTFVVVFDLTRLFSSDDIARVVPEAAE
ncbi:MAG: chemotaxis protein CheW [Rhodospirillaceae bacterium]|nr:chemotaxis protein CheW [Rhodospirillales bacterium]